MRMKCVLLDQARAQSGKPPLIQIWKAIKQGSGDNAIQDAITNELQSLIMRRAEATMSKRLNQKRRRRKPITQSTGESIQVHG